MWGWLIRVSLLGLTLFACGLAFIAYEAYNALTSPLQLDKPVLFEIKSGTSTIAAMDNLSHYSSNPAIDSLYFSLYARATNTQIKAGEYELTPEINARESLALFQKGSNFHRRVTLREGLTSFEIVRILNAREDLTGDVKAIPAEGTLLPETYSYSKNEPRAEVVKRMQSAMTKALNEAWENRAKDIPIKTKEEALILASIIEKETGKPGEHDIVAGVFINRLRKGMPLQTDPTVIYAITKGEHKNDGKGPLGRRLLSKDLKYDSPYNTYLYPGLPPGPIANPGIASIKAALNPAVHDYIYFVADGTGGHAFGKTLAEHNANVTKWRKIRANQ